MFEGLYVALVTPFTEDDKVNIEKLKELVAFHVRQGTDGLVLYGTTGEGGCLDGREQSQILETVINEASGKLKVIAGCGVRSTRQTVLNVQATRDAGADGALVVTPFYNRPCQEGLYQHFRTAAEAVNLPIMLYNVPTRTGVDMLPETVKRLSELPNIVAIKEARPDTDRLTTLVTECGKTMDVLTGHDPNIMPALTLGCKGVVSVIGNIDPAGCRQLIEAVRSGDSETAAHLHYKFSKLCAALSGATNPIPVKEAMNLLGWEMGPVRLPLVPLSDEKRNSLKNDLESLGYTL